MSEPFSLPDGFRFGVATAGYQIEGGYNGPGEPQNNWYEWERDGRVEPSGIALDFWNRYEEQLDRAARVGLDAFRLSVEWARCEPAEGEYDDEAFARYEAILRACQDRGLRPLVTLHHFTHPGWLGADFWPRREAPERFAGWAGEAVRRLGEHCDDWVTINELNIYALSAYLFGAHPPGRWVARSDLGRTLDHLLTGHVLAYDQIRRLRPDAVVATNNFCFSIYEIDRLLTDVLLARHHGVGRTDLGAWLQDRRAAYLAAMGPMPPLEKGLRRYAARALPLERALPHTVDAVYDSPHEVTLDVTQVDYYNPYASSHFRPPGHVTAGGRSLEPLRQLWDDPPDPVGFAHFTRLNHEAPLPVWVVENGLCNRVRNGRSHPRGDGWDRPRYLRANLGALADLVERGVPVGAYFHWTLADNYEWGSYEPRFGLFGVDRERGVRWSDRDAMGQDSAAAFRRIIEGLREGDRSVVD